MLRMMRSYLVSAEEYKGGLLPLHPSRAWGNINCRFEVHAGELCALTCCAEKLESAFAEKKMRGVMTPHSLLT